MGWGDNIIATGLAKGSLAKRSRRIAFGANGVQRWDKHSEEIFRGNPNIAPIGSEWRGRVEWIKFYKGQRGYNKSGGHYWIWNMGWRCEPGEIFLTEGEQAAGKRQGSGFVVIEPNVVAWKSSAKNKDWGFGRYQAVADQLRESGQEVIQFTHEGGGAVLDGVRAVKTTSFRDAVAVLKNAEIYVGGEGGLHHAAAAVGIKGVVLFGGFIPPSVTGYRSHTNLAGSDIFCGSFSTCDHCRTAMASISVERVTSAVKERLNG